MLRVADMNIHAAYVALRLGIRPDTTVLDVGGSAAGFEYGTVTNVDLRPGESGERIVAVDLCRDRLPFEDNEFDVCICAHTLEDLDTPFLALDEIKRVAKKGYLETPHRGSEACFGVSPEQGVYPGWGHHKWMFETTGPGSFRVIAKTWHLLRHDAEKVGLWAGPSSFEFFWHDDFEYTALQILDQDGDHWGELVAEHNEFVAANRQLIQTVDELRGQLTPVAPGTAVWTQPMFESTAPRRESLPV